MRKLAGTFYKGLKVCSQDLVSKFGSDHSRWTWAAGHASWVLNRFQPVKGALPDEPVHGKSYKGLLAEYGWHVCLLLGRLKGKTPMRSQMERG